MKWFVIYACLVVLFWRRPKVEDMKWHTLILLGCAAAAAKDQSKENDDA